MIGVAEKLSTASPALRTTTDPYDSGGHPFLILGPARTYRKDLGLYGGR